MDSGEAMETHATVKGQIVIPAEVRRRLSIKKGTRLNVDVNEQTRQIILTPITREFVQKICGKYKGRGLLEALVEEKERERKL
jgi:AbrB family looped-hinge helix DNA binding protein